ncbi:MAG: deoxyribonuclease IV [Actinomycetota bacterium]
MIFGAHVRTKGGILSVFDLAKEEDADAVQLFASNPRQWRGPSVSDERATEFRSRWKEAGLGPLYFHAPYLVNIASPNPEFHGKSVELAKASMVAAEVLGAEGLVVHAGAGGPGEPEHALERAAGCLRAVADASDAFLIVELMAGTMGSVATTIPEAARLFEAVDHPRLRLCLDTCHLFAGGYALDTVDGVRRCFDEVRSLGLEERLVLMHANDAKFPRDSRRDRHENVGKGFIGREGFAAILADPAVQRCSVVVETPGTHETHREDVATLRELAA